MLLYYLQLYNGNTGRTYGQALYVGIDGTLGEDANGGLSFVYFQIAGIRNSATGDGMALVDGQSDTVIEFISYDGTFTATNGPASGMQSVDIGVTERGGVGLVGLSLQLGGVGCTRSDFSWQTVQVATMGSVNAGQVGGCTSGAPSITIVPSKQPSVFPSRLPSASPSLAPSVAPVSITRGRSHPATSISHLSVLSMS